MKKPFFPRLLVIALCGVWCVAPLQHGAGSELANRDIMGSICFELEKRMLEMDPRLLARVLSGLKQSSSFMGRDPMIVTVFNAIREQLRLKRATDEVPPAL